MYPKEQDPRKPGRQPRTDATEAATSRAKSRNRGLLARLFHRDPLKPVGPLPMTVHYLRGSARPGAC
ncbi:MAG: hypothetical protein Kilf2KO_28790 [Rhodospirillales bacterium]